MISITQIVANITIASSFRNTFVYSIPLVSLSVYIHFYEEVQPIICINIQYIRGTKTTVQTASWLIKVDLVLIQWNFCWAQKVLHYPTGDDIDNYKNDIDWFPPIHTYTDSHLSR